MRASTVIGKWGNSLGVRIPAALAVRAHIREGSRVDLVEENGRIVVSPEPEPTLKDLLAQVKPGNRPALVDWGKPVGKEVWKTKSLCILVSLLGVWLLAGCQHQAGDPLQASAAALRQNDFDQAILLANESLDEDATGAKAAEALYLRGRAYEERPAISYAQMLANLHNARASYTEALRHNPPAKLATYIRASLGKVAFYQDDFQTAMQQLWIAYNELDDRELRAGTLYHMGKSQQRSGQFTQADQTFTTLISNFGQSGWAAKAAEVRGAKGFYVQLGTYGKPEVMESAAKLVRDRGMKPVTLKDGQGRFLLRAGPYSTYAQAKQMRPKLADAFPDATIVP